MCRLVGHSTLVFLTVLIAISSFTDEATAGGGNYANCNNVNFGPSCFATYNNHYLRVWNPDGTRPSFSARQKSDLWNNFLNLHAQLNQNTSYHSGSYTLDPNDVFHDLDSIGGDNSFLQNLLRDWEPVKSQFCLKKYNAALIYMRAIIAQEGATENSHRLAAARFLLSEPSGGCLNKRDSKNYYDRISKESFAKKLKQTLGIDPDRYGERFAELSGWLNYLAASSHYHARPHFLRPKVFDELILAFETLANDYGQSWVGEAAFFTALQLRFEVIQGGFDESPFYDLSLWREKYEEFLVLYSGSTYEVTLHGYANGVDFYNGKRHKHFRHLVDLVNNGLLKIQNQRKLLRTEIISMASFPYFLDAETQLELQSSDHELILDFSFLITGSNSDALRNLCNLMAVRGPIGTEVCEQVDIKEINKTPAFKLTPEARIARIQYFSASGEYTKAFGLLGNLDKDEEKSKILMLGHMFASADISNNIDEYIEALIGYAVERQDDATLQLLTNYQLTIFSEFLASEESMQRVLSFSLPEKMRFAVLKPHIEQAVLYGDYTKAISLFSGLSGLRKNITEGDVLGTRHKSLFRVIDELNQGGAERDFLVGSHIYLFGLIPTCLAREPRPLNPSKSKVCGFMSIDNSMVKFVKKERSNLGQTPLELFRIAQQKLSGSELPSPLEVKILNRLIYCFKGSYRRYSCTRQKQVEKKEVKQWFTRLNRDERRQKHWYFDNIFFEPDAWPNFFKNSKVEPISLGFGPAESYYLLERGNR